MADWKEVLYQSYVSSGQILVAGNSAADHLRGRRAYLERVIGAFFPADRASRIFDIGCGHGALLYFLQKAGYREARGVDGSAEQVELARSLGIVGVEHGDGYKFLSARADASAEAVCLFDVLEHLTRQQAFDLISEVRRVLSPGGLCIGHAPNAAGIFGARVRYGDLTHEMAFTPDSIRQMFRALQFGQVRCFEDKPAVHGVKSAVRRVLWELGTMPFRLLAAAETGSGGAILSQNLLFAARKERSPSSTI